MRENISRRTLIAGGIGGVGVLGGGRYAWTQYATRNTLRLRPLECINRSSEHVELTLTVLVDREAVGDPRYVTLAPVDQEPDNQMHWNGHWIKKAQEYAVRAEVNGEELYLANSDIVTRLPDSGWGSDCASVRILVTEQGTLSSEIDSVEFC